MALQAGQLSHRKRRRETIASNTKTEWACAMQGF